MLTTRRTPRELSNQETGNRKSLIDLARLITTQSYREAIDEKLLNGGRRGWPIILSGLKTLLEPGHLLPQLDPAR
jgi:hypothetical protein